MAIVALLAAILATGSWSGGGRAGGRSDGEGSGNERPGSESHGSEGLGSRRSASEMPRECLADARPIRPLHPPIVVHLSDRTALPPDLLDEMMREAARVWQAGGVTVQWSPGVAGAEVQVIVTRTIAESVMQAAVARRPLASILFVDGRPTTLIRVYPQEAERLLEHERLGDRPLVQRPPKLRFRLVGRALGRAIAHELGHYLFASATHTMTGLMRASHPTGHLLSSSVRNFHVIAPPPRSCTVLARRTFKN